MDAALLQQFFQERSDWRVCQACAEAEVVLLLGCCATQDKEDLTRETIEWLRRTRGTDAHILVAGCITKTDPELAGKNGKFKDLVEQINGLLDLKGRQDLAVNAPQPEFWQIGRDILDPAVAANMIRRYCHRDVGTSWLRAFPKCQAALIRLFTAYRRWVDKEILSSYDKTYCMKVSTGCLGICSYCSIRLARGRVKSKDPDILVQEFQRGLDQGYRDFALLGTDIGDYGKDLGVDLLDLLERLVAHERKFTLRLRNVNPRWLIPSAPRFCELLTTGKIGYILAPMESGSNRVLDRMNRRYCVEDYLEAIKEIRAAWPRIFIKNQVMVGFPGETQEDFNRTKQVLKRGLFDYTDVCAFTRRPKTKAWDLPDQVPDEVIAKRYRDLRFMSFVQLPLKRRFSSWMLKYRRPRDPDGNPATSSLSDHRASK
jgi:tRNA A37 methylthiotransferase MiaB